MNRDLTKYVKCLRAMKQQGFTVDVMLELAFGEVPKSDYSAEERAAVLDLYRKELPSNLRSAS